jgi:aryl-alcohol dehydrogenase-like predicted oxidoreductase
MCEPRLVAGEVERLLRDLRTDRLDAFVLHRDDPRFPVAAWAEALGGTAAGLGVSNWTVERFAALEAELPAGSLHVFSNHFSLAELGEPPWEGCRSIDAAGVRGLVRAGVEVLAWSSLAHGFLTDAGGGDPDVVRSWDTEANRRRRDRATELAESLGVTTAAVALAYVLAHGARPIVGARTEAELADSLVAERLELSPEQVAQLAG